MRALTYSYGLSTSSIILAFHILLFRLNPAPGNHEGKYFTEVQ